MLNHLQPRALAVVAGLAIVASAGTGCGQLSRTGNGAATAAIEDEDVQRVHARMIDAMGGGRAWERARYFEFDFVVVREGSEASRWSHRWDRYDGDLRMSGVRRGEPIVVIMNVNRPEEPAQAWIDGQPVAGAQLDSLRTFAYGRFINDSYWLIMPYKWTDPGVRHAYLGERHEADRDWEVVHISFDDVGLTPQNEYLAYIDPATGLMERWYHYPRADADPAIFDWTDWQQFGPILLSTEKPNAARTVAIRFDNVRVDRRVPADAFAP
jgi:hypothetical protein